MKKPEFLNKFTNHNCMYNEAIIWDEYGYWQEPRPGFTPQKPEWCTDKFTKEAQQFAKNLVEPDTKLWFEVWQEPNGIWSGTWVTYDEANKVIYFDCAVSQCKTEKSCINYIKKRHVEHKWLYDGVIKALLVYKNTGIACLPDWNTNKIDSYGYKDGNKNRIPRASKVK